jgi:hypothetical protein
MNEEGKSYHDLKSKTLTSIDGQNWNQISGL